MSKAVQARERRFAVLLERLPAGGDAGAEEVPRVRDIPGDETEIPKDEGGGEMKSYLGDSVYADFDGYMVILTTENGTGEASNRIFMEPQVFGALQDFVGALTASEGDADNAEEEDA